MFTGFRRGLFISITYIPEVGHQITLRISLFLYMIHFYLSHTIRQLSSHNLPREIRAGPVLDVQIWHILFLVDMVGKFGNIPSWNGVMVSLFG